MMRRVGLRFLVFQHVEVEHPGAFRDLWRKAGIEWTTVELDRGEPIPADLSPFDALVVMGGPMNVWQTDEIAWLAPEIAAIGHFVADLQKPYLGVCLGHQLLAVALGGEVGPAGASEVGSYSVRLAEAARSDVMFQGLASPLPVFQWHGAEVKRPPRGAVVLAESDLCAVQAFRWGRHAYGVQFHAEITAQTPSEWWSLPDAERSLEAALGPGAGARLAAETRDRLGAYGATAEQLSGAFLNLIATDPALAR